MKLNRTCNSRDRMWKEFILAASASAGERLWSRVWLPMRSVDCSIDPNFQAYSGPGGDSTSNINQYQESSWGGGGLKRGRRVKVHSLTAICERTVYKMWEPRRHVYVHVVVSSQECRAKSRHKETDPFKMWRSSNICDRQDKWVPTWKYQHRYKKPRFNGRSERPRWPRDTPLSAKVGNKIRRSAVVVSRYSSLAD
jgi:hypothetical protein